MCVVCNFLHFVIEKPEYFIVVISKFGFLIALVVLA